MPDNYSVVFKTTSDKLYGLSNPVLIAMIKDACPSIESQYLDEFSRRELIEIIARITYEMTNTKAIECK